MDMIEVLMAHELNPTVGKDGHTMWTCRTCADVSIDPTDARHAIAQATHQAAKIAEAIRERRNGDD